MNAASANDINRCSARILDAALRVHSVVGPGLLESAYEACLCRELELRGLRAVRQVPIALVYEGVRVDVAFRADVIVDDMVVLELKATEKLTPVFSTTLLTYLRLSGYRLGMLINFHEQRLKDGVKRVANEL